MSVGDVACAQIAHVRSGAPTTSRVQSQSVRGRLPLAIFARTADESIDAIRRITHHAAGGNADGPSFRPSLRVARAELSPYVIFSGVAVIGARPPLPPRALAVLRLMTNSNVVGCSTGRSAASRP